MALNNAPLPTDPFETVSFPSGRRRCRARLYVPNAKDIRGPVPIVVMAHGLGGVKELRLPAFAERFRAAGFASLVFDYRHFGESDGEPRELISVQRQRADWLAAISFARSLPAVDPASVIVWGTSFAGGHAIWAGAQDPIIKAIVAQCPFTDGLASTRQMSPVVALRLASLGVADLLTALARRAPIRVPLAASNGRVGLMNAPDALTGVQRLFTESGVSTAEMRLAVPARVALRIPLTRPGRFARRLRQPALFCVCNADSVAPARATVRHVTRAPLGELVRYDEGHFDVYSGPAFEEVVEDQLNFLRKVVRGTRTADTDPPLPGASASEQTTKELTR